MVMVQQRRDRPWVFADLEAFPEDRVRYEILAGTLSGLATPGGYHGQANSNLIDLLLPVAKAAGGKLYTAALSVFFPMADPVRPDLTVCLTGNRAAKTEPGIVGVPDLVVEIVWPPERVHDTLTKRALYGIAGVPEYWIVDPDPQAPTVEVLALEGNALRSRSTFAGQERVASAVLPGVGFAAADAFAGFAEIAG